MLGIPIGSKPNAHNSRTQELSTIVRKNWTLRVLASRLHDHTKGNNWVTSCNLPTDMDKTQSLLLRVQNDLNAGDTQVDATVVLLDV